MCPSIRKQQHYIITVDGPAGSGKSSLAKNLALKLHAYHLNSGLLYRAVTKILCDDHLLQQKTLPAVDDFLQHLDLNELHHITMQPQNGRFLVVVNKQDWSDILHTKELDRATAWLAASPIIRDFVLGLQRHAGTLSDLVIDGRDCGTVVFPWADTKIYLTASSRARASRIAKRNKIEPSDTAALAKLEAQIIERDLHDQERATSPLRPASDAIIVDNTNLNAEQTLNHVLKIVTDKKIND
jgi:cytidylate kinase